MKTILAVPIAAALACCTHALAAPPYRSVEKVAGTLRIAGGDTMYGVVSAWGAAFSRFHPHATLVIDRTVKLSADGVTGLLAGQTDVVTYVREPFDAERIAVRQKLGAQLQTTVVAGGSYATRGGTHALAVYVNAANPLARLSLRQLEAAWARSGSARTWGDLGATGEWAARPVHVVGMLTVRGSGNPPGIVNYLNQRVLKGRPWRDDLTEIVDRPGLPALAGIVAAVAADPDAIGYSGFGFATAGVKSLALCESDDLPCYPGSEAQVAAHTYPLSRYIYLGHALGPGAAPSPLLREFLRFVLSAEGQQAVRSDPAGFLPLPETQP